MSETKSITFEEYEQKKEELYNEYEINKKNIWKEFREKEKQNRQNVADFHNQQLWKKFGKEFELHRLVNKNIDLWHQKNSQLENNSFKLELKLKDLFNIPLKEKSFKIKVFKIIEVEYETILTVNAINSGKAKEKAYELATSDKSIIFKKTGKEKDGHVWQEILNQDSEVIPTKDMPGGAG